MGTGRDTTVRAVEALRRIVKLEADRRRVQRSRSRCTPGSDYAQELDRQLAELEGQIEHLGAIVTRAEAQGFKIWTRADFRKGDFVQYRGVWYEVLRVNAKSLTVPAVSGTGRTWTLAYTDDLTGRRSVDEMAREGANENACLRHGPGD
jgi:hypothetical protein